LSALGEKLALGKLLSLRGHIALWVGQDARGFLERAQALAQETAAGAGGELGRAIARLQRAIAASQEAGAGRPPPRLFRGDLVEDLTEGQRRWLAETGQLPL